MVKTKFGKFYLLERIAEGGMGEIFIAKEFGISGFERIVALKRILPEFSKNPKFITMFQEEAILAGKINHPNIVYTYELGEINGTFYISMEYIHGDTLDFILDYFRTNNVLIPLKFIFKIVSEICLALDYAHNLTYGDNLELIHRDIKPRNIMFSYESNTLKLIDFGVAKNLKNKSATLGDVIKGTPDYMSPEQVEGEKLDKRSDIFSFGIILWELLTNQRLFDYPTFKETCNAILCKKIDPPSKYNSSIPPKLDDIVLKSLSRNKDERYEDIKSILKDINEVRDKFQDYSTNSDFTLYLRNYMKEHISNKDKKLETYKKVKLDEISGISNSSSKLKRENKLKKSEESTAELPNTKSKIKSIILNNNIRGWLLLAILLLVIFSFPTYFLIESLEGKKGFIRIISNPQEAEVFINGRHIGKTPSQEVAVKAGNKHLIQVYKKGFNNFSQEISVSEGERRTIPIDLIEKGSIYISSIPSNAEVYLNGKKVSETTPYKIINLDPTISHTITVQALDYIPYTQNIKLSPGENLELNVKLEPSNNITSKNNNKIGFLSIDTVPEGATVYINNILIRDQKTPISKFPIKSGQLNNILIKKEGYEDWSDNISVKPGELYYISERLTPIEKEQKAKLNIISNPSGAVVFIDSIKLPQTTPIYSYPVIPKKYKITLNLDNYEPYETEVDAKPEQLVKINHTFRLSKIGTLIVNSKPWTYVYIDNKKIDQTPVFINNVTTGNHKLRLFNPDFNIDKEYDIKVGKDEPTRLSYEFKGTLSVILSEKAQVLINGEKIGYTPIYNYSLLVGNYEMKIKFEKMQEEKTFPISISMDKETLFTDKSIR